MLTDETVTSIAGSFAAEWGLRLSRTDVKAWHGRLMGAGMTEGNHAELFRQFRDTYPLEKRKPSLAEFARFVWKATAAARAGARAASGPAREDCFFCGGTGWVAMAVPIGPQGGYDPGARGFEPPAVWTRTPVYRGGVPCMCSAGGRAGQISPAWADARKRAVEKFPGGDGLSAYLRDCWQARARNQAAVAAGGAQGNTGGPSDALGPIEPEIAAEGDYRGITGNGLDTAGVREQAVAGTAKRTADVDSRFDVPEDEIPW